MSLRLLSMLVDARLPQRELARAVGMGVASLNRLIHSHQFPVRKHPDQVRAAVTAFLQARGVADAGWEQEEAEPPGCRPAAPDHHRQDKHAIPEETTDMLLKKYRLTQAAKQHFELSADPFEDVEDIAEVFLSDDIRYIREAMFSTAMHSRFLAVIGESGAGKSTLREELIDRLQREGRDVHVIEPSVLEMAESETKGQPLRVRDIAAAVMATVAPMTPLKSGREARARQLKHTLVESHRAGFKHLILIEEAHAIPTATLNHLKRLLEIKDGLRKVLGIVLLGQPELELKLSETNPQVREVVQRIEILTLPPLDNNLEAYLKHRFERAGVPVARVLERGGLDALRARLAADKKGGMSLMYPQAVHNVLAAAMNLAAKLGPARVTADVVREV